MAFWGCPLNPGQKKEADLKPGEILHVSQVCLHEAKPGKTYLQLEVKGTTYTVAVLEKDKREHDALDLMFAADDKPKFHAKGSSPIHLVGYTEPELDAEELEEEKEAVQATKASPKMLAAAKASPKAAPAPSPKAKAAPSPKAAAAPSPKQAAAKAAAKEKEDDDEDLLEGEGEEGEEEEPRAKDPVVDPEPKGKAAAKEGKRKADAPAAGAPAGKKAKDDAEPLKPEEGDYVQKLVSFLKSNGKTNIGQLGSKVQRPKNLPKLKDILKKHAGKFKVTGESVEAA